MKKAFHYMRGHSRSDGTYVDGYRSTNPNNTKADNWGTKGNYNPYTRKQSTKDPW